MIIYSLRVPNNRRFIVQMKIITFRNRCNHYKSWIIPYVLIGSFKIIHDNYLGSFDGRKQQRWPPLLGCSLALPQPMPLWESSQKCYQYFHDLLSNVKETLGRMQLINLAKIY